MPRPKNTGGQARILTPVDIRKIDAYAKAKGRHRDRALFWLGLGTGMRISELAQLKIADVTHTDWSAAGQITLQKHATKNRKSRIVDVSRQAIEPLSLWLGLLQAGGAQREDVLFPSRKRARCAALSAKSAGEIIRLLALEAGVEHVRSHSLRRTFTTRLCDSGAPIKYAQAQLGHSSIKTTALYYEVSESKKRILISGLRLQ